MAEEHNNLHGTQDGRLTPPHLAPDLKHFNLAAARCHNILAHPLGEQPVLWGIKSSYMQSRAAINWTSIKCRISPLLISHPVQFLAPNPNPNLCPTLHSFKRAYIVDFLSFPTMQTQLTCGFWPDKAIQSSDFSPNEKFVRPQCCNLQRGHKLKPNEHKGTLCSLVWDTADY